ncbi:tRNA glutamyl-Q(34) synthetase GluQRS [Sulfitobacter donghicola]|uniref:Glutamyl-Q tRNA(Asp) ligase n=1 Tax=Sulfitobacter donghicola DSW-25 = KCTC 12864 = JCM 14565 TaxID=1300350 RepID=A0A073IFV8_9RHOB|nr:tRNA glutamyl-Q(34) synthetase GluQRS [Sulfitobacter donghicola]KEJ88381.1 glutamyl-Q tRNA(Asp) ligase [Sulfitobacter donghicola DSW-25 = KCTC 12864 = JCM 14565]KIN69755.1 Glutamyl-Q-tRNA synthetase [Sulfitobacter donghicola DSW-25 = KCTC 12864 = JCM 14565]
MSFITRFAPSPTGPLHLGHAYSALLAYDMAQKADGAFLLRIEDIDRSRAREHWENQIYDDLAWLGIRWQEPVMRQSERQPDYTAALDDLWARGLIYPCSCTRADIAAAASAPQEGAPLLGPDGVIYPGTCRDFPLEGATPPQNVALRLNMRKACDALQKDLSFSDSGMARETTVSADELIHGVGDIVIARRDMGTSYHLSVVLDDAAQEVTHVIRGEDLFDATKIHILLQSLLGLEQPQYHHHRLIRDEAGKRLAKRDDARAISLFRAEGATPQDIREMVGL